jgi:hypothetical protein
MLEIFVQIAHLCGEVNHWDSPPETMGYLMGLLSNLLLEKLKTAVVDKNTIRFLVPMVQFMCECIKIDFLAIVLSEEDILGVFFKSIYELVSQCFGRV